MKKVLIIEASNRKGFSSEVALQIKNDISKSADVELIELRNYNIIRCKGCCACLSIGSSSCPLKDDDVKIILEKLEQSDGVIFIIPNYALSVPGILKDLFDRLSFVFHRPRLFCRVCLPIVVQGIFGGNKITKYVNEVMGFWGMNAVKGVVVTGGIYPKKGLKDETKGKNSKMIMKALGRFLEALYSKKPIKPSLFKIMIFRMTRSSIKYFDDALEPDKNYYERKGWISSDYYYDVKINPIKKLIGKFFDIMIKKMAKKSKELN